MGLKSCIMQQVQKVIYSLQVANVADEESSYDTNLAVFSNFKKNCISRSTCSLVQDLANIALSTQKVVQNSILLI